STTARPPTTWSPTENVKWKVALPGRGSGSPVVWGNRVFVVTAVSADGSDAERGRRAHLQFDLLCYDRGKGELLWRETAAEATPHEGTHGTNGYSSASPCTDGKHVFAHFGSRGIHCYTVDGKHVWSRQLGKLNMRNGFGEGSSPTLVDGRVIVPWDHEGDSFLFALDARTGKPIWQVARDEPSCWATPLIVEHAGRKQIVMNGQTCARSYDLETGEELWRCGGQTQRPVASAVAAGGLVFVGSGHRGSYLGAFRPDGKGDIAGTPSVVWTQTRDTPDIASPLLSGERLYFFKGKSGVISCVDATTGHPHYATKRTELRQIYASPIAAGGHVYLTDRDGTTVVIEDADELNVVATNSVGETVDATPAPVENELYIRGEKHLFCIAE
ncbi:MAG: PQQ-binding-like beta-propeller repeat protein, partial [Aeoliella sp.]